VLNTVRLHSEPIGGRGGEDTPPPAQRGVLVLERGNDATTAVDSGSDRIAGKL